MRLKCHTCRKDITESKDICVHWREGRSLGGMIRFYAIRVTHKLCVVKGLYFSPNCSQDKWNYFLGSTFNLTGGFLFFWLGALFLDGAEISWFYLAPVLCIGIGFLTLYNALVIVMTKFKIALLSKENYTYSILSLLGVIVFSFSWLFYLFAPGYKVSGVLELVRALFA